MRPDAQAEAALRAVLENFRPGIAARDAQGVERLLVRNADVAIVRSEEAVLRGPDEIRAFLQHQHYARGITTYTWAWDRVDMSDGTIGWVLAEGTERVTSKHSEQRDRYRMTMMCEKRNGRWLLFHVHGSSPHKG